MIINNTNCPFCKKEKIHKQIIFESDETMIILPLHQRGKGHLLVIPKIHVDSIVSLPDEYLKDMFEQFKKAELLLEKAYSASNFNILTNQGKLAGQSVFHLHFHLLPRFEGEESNPLFKTENDLVLSQEQVILQDTEFLKEVFKSI